MLDVEQWPEVVDPVLVYSFTGWVDAGLAGLGTLELLVDQIGDRGGGRFGAVDLTDLLDLQQTRPTVRLEHGDVRRIVWPEVELWSGRLGRDVICVRGPEPSIRWPAFAQWIVDVATHLRVRDAYALGGMPAVTTHRRPVPVLASATRRSVAQEVGPLRDDYLGATGLNTVVQHALGEAGVRSVALWAQVPQYVSGSPSPPAVRSLAARLVDLAQLDVDLAGVDVRAALYRDKVEEGLADRPDVLAIVDQIDQQLDQRIPSADELASEIEQYLRGRPED